MFLRLLPTTGVYDQHLGIFLGLLPAAGVCDRRKGVLITLLASAGLWDLPKAPYYQSSEEFILFAGNLSQLDPHLYACNKFDLRPNWL